MKAFSRLCTYGRFAVGLRRFLRRRLTLEEAEAFIREQLGKREENFLRLVERGVYGYRRSPYRALLQMAGCEFGDLRAMVVRDGMEAAL